MIFLTESNSQWAQNHALAIAIFIIVCLGILSGRELL